jgi:hypothetical protein
MNLRHSGMSGAVKGGAIKAVSSASGNVGNF